MTPRKAPSDLTERVFAALEDFIAEHGYSPTLSELSGLLYLSRSGVYRHLDKLAAEGRIAWEPGRARTLRILKPE